MKNTIDKQMLEKQMHKPKEKADVVFNKLLAQQKKPKNPFDEARTQSYPAVNLKPGGNINESL
ncbi:MAG: hypothetical protein KGZ85_03180 [Ignavibacterium sp.]|nr:hypothetical protein [Ignavibacterium sp.]